MDINSIDTTASREPQREGSTPGVPGGDLAPLLSVRDLRTEFVTEEGTVQAVRGLSFDVSPGEALGLVGESGCGKSVTAHSIMGLIKPPGRIASGEIWFEGQNLRSLSDRKMRAVRGRRIGMIFQDPMSSLNPVLTIGRQLTESLEVHLGLSGHEAEEQALEYLSTVGIPSPRQRFDDHPHQFSGGMRQRVMIAMALSCEPSLLIADEPTTALDVTIQAQILELLARLQEEMGLALILITHDLGVVAGITDRVNVMYAGQVVETAPMRAIFKDPRHPYTSGLLSSIPRLTADRTEDLPTIPGAPPDLVDPPKGCAFWSRCSYRLDERCESEMPPLRSVGSDHQVACFYDVNQPVPV